jgi:hypothetical protein
MREIIPIGTTLSLDELKISPFIIANGKDLIITHRIYVGREGVKDYLLFYDSSLVLYSLYYKPFWERLHFIRNDTISYYQDPYEDGGVYCIRGKLPANYKLIIGETDTAASSQMNKYNTLVDSIRVEATTLNVKLFVHKNDSNTLDYGVDSFVLKDDYFAVRFRRADTLIFPLGKLYFDYKSGKVSTFKKDGYYHCWDKMGVKVKTFDDFYDQIWAILNRGKKGKK